MQGALIFQIIYENNSKQIKIKEVKTKETKNIYKYSTNFCDLQMYEILEFSSNIKI